MRLRAIAALGLLSLAACDRDPAPLAPDSAAGFLPCVFGNTIQLDVGEVFTGEGADAELLCLSASGDGAEYTLVPFYASATGVARVTFSLTGANTTGVTGPPNPAVLPDPSPGAALAGNPLGEAFHRALRERELRELGSLLRRAGAAHSRSVAPTSARAAAAVPREGDLLPLNTSVSCDDPDIRIGRVAAVTQHAIVVTDTANPPGGFTDAELRSFGITFDTLIYPVDVRNFGTTVDIDENGRSIIFFTRAVNELTPPGSRGFVAGFFWAGDLFPTRPEQALRADLGICPFSNYAEMFYQLAPDPQGVVNGQRFSTELVRRITLSTIGHEFQHLINAERRLYVNNATQFEEPWLNEALSHMAEELLFYEVTGLQPRQNLDAQTVFGRFPEAAAIYMNQNFARFRLYLEEPDTNSLMGIDNLETRGAAWAFLRYAADREPGPDRDFFLALVNSTAAGVQNLERVLQASPLDWMQDWTVSVYTDDAVPTDPRYQQPSWNFRSIEPLFVQSNTYPLKVHLLAGTRQFTLRAGGAAFVRFGIDPAGRTALRLLQGEQPPPQALRISLVRTR